MSNYDMIIIRGGSMASRMDRYRNQDVEPTGMRTKRNEHLYAKVDAPLEYSSVEGVARIENTSSVDINKIKELLLREEEPKKRPHRFQEEKSLEDTDQLATFKEMDDKNYDIRDILNKAKNNRGEEEEDRYRNLQNTGYDLLKTMKIKEEEPQFTEEEIEHVGDTTLSLSLFDQLDDEEERREQERTIQNLLQDDEMEPDDEDDDFEDGNIDTSFFTSSLNFSDDDFSEISEELEKPKRKGSFILKILLFLIMVALTTFAIFFLADYLR